MNFHFRISSLPLGHLRGSVFLTVHARLFLESVSCAQQIFILCLELTF